MNNAKSKSTLKKFLQLIIVSFLAKGLAFGREMVLAYFYGANAVVDVYVAVQAIPGMICTLLGVAITTCFIPLYTEQKTNKGKESADKFANNIFNIFLVLSTILAILGIIFSKQLVMVFAGGFTGSTFDMCNNFAKIVTPTCIAVTLSYIYNSYLQIYDSFNQNSLMNVPYNICQIVFIAIGFYTGRAYVLAFGLLLASFSQLFYLRILMSKRTDFKHSGYFNPKEPHFKEMLILVAPVFLSASVNQVNVIVDKSLASRLQEGIVASLNYSSEVANVATQVVILSLTTILYPKMTALFAKKENNERFDFTAKYINVVSFLVLPMAAMMCFFSKEIIEILFARGEFTQETVGYVSNALKMYALGVVGMSYWDAFNKVFYSMKNTVIPMINGIIAVCINIGLNFLLIKRYEYLGLAFATSFASTICSILLFIQLTRKIKELNTKFILLELAKILLATGAMLGSLYGADALLNIQNNILRCITFAPIGALVYGLVLIITKSTIAKEGIEKLTEKIKK